MEVTKQAARIGAGGVLLSLEEVAADAVLAVDLIETLPPAVDAPKGAFVWRNGRWLRRAALLDERDVFQKVDLLEADQPLSARHVASIVECDLPPGQYRWERDKDGNLAGPFLPLPPQQRAKTGRPTLEMGVGFELLQRWQANPQSLHELTLAWLDDLVQSSDFKNLRRPEVVAYAAARKIDLGTES